MNTINMRWIGRGAWRAAALAGLLLGAAAPPAAAAVLLGAQQDSYEGLAPGDTFTVTLFIQSTEAVPVVAYDFYIRGSANSTFLVASQTLGGPLDQPNALATLPHPVTMTDTTDFGAFDDNFTDGIGIGTTVVQTLVFQIDPAAAPGSYTLFFGWNQPLATGGPSFLDSQVNEFQMQGPLALTIGVIPEPGAPLLVAVSAVAWLGRRRRRMVAGNSSAGT